MVLHPGGVAPCLPSVSLHTQCGAPHIGRGPYFGPGTGHMTSRPPQPCGGGCTHLTDEGQQGSGSQASVSSLGTRPSPSASSAPREVCQCLSTQGVCTGCEGGRGWVGTALGTCVHLWHISVAAHVHPVASGGRVAPADLIYRFAGNHRAEREGRCVRGPAPGAGPSKRAREFQKELLNRGLDKPRKSPTSPSLELGRLQEKPVGCSRLS